MNEEQINENSVIEIVGFFLHSIHSILVSFQKLLRYIILCSVECEHFLHYHAMTSIYVMNMMKENPLLIHQKDWLHLYKSCLLRGQNGFSGVQSKDV